MFQFQKFPFKLGLAKIAEHINTLMADGWLVLGFQHIPASDGPGILVFGLMRSEDPIDDVETPDETPDEAPDTETVSDKNGHADDLGAGEIVASAVQPS